MDVYDMLGVKCTSSLVEVRKAYRGMALLCHPDKGGSAEDMRALKRSYDWICSQLEAVELESQKGTFEEREAEFQAFMKAQADDRVVPSWSEIEMEAMGVSKADVDSMKQAILARVGDSAFLCDMTIRRTLHMYEHDRRNRTLHQCLHQCLEEELKQSLSSETIHSSIQGGYGTMMDASSVHEDGLHELHGLLELQTPSSTSFGQQELVMYQEPALLEYVGWNGPSAEIPMPVKLEDYSVGATMCDYRVAHTETYNMSVELEKLYDTEGKFSMSEDDVMKMRNEMDDVISGSRHELQLLFKKRS